jgi:LPXTG-site transpeptidase (sortase) family protein
MFQLYKKIRDSWIKSILFSCFLLAIFLVLFYLANLDIKPAKKNPPVDETSLSLNTDAELKKKLGSTDVNYYGYTQWTQINELASENNKYDDDPDGDGLPNYLEYAYGTDPLKADTDSDGFSDRQEITNGYDPNAPGDAKPVMELSIDKINVDAPMIWSTSEDENSQLKDLENGVVHFPKTASPGQSGNMIISGHSSNYIWAAGNYNHIFTDLNNLNIGDVIIIKTIQKNGRIITYHYNVSGKDVVAPDDQKIFEVSDTPTLTLSTCWPLGTAFRRLIIKAELVK